MNWFKNLFKKKAKEKVALYRHLLQKDPDSLTDREVNAMFDLSKDTDIQEMLNR